MPSGTPTRGFSQSRCMYLTNYFSLQKVLSISIPTTTYHDSILSIGLHIARIELEDKISSLGLVFFSLSSDSNVTPCAQARTNAYRARARRPTGGFIGKVRFHVRWTVGARSLSARSAANRISRRAEDPSSCADM